MKGSLKCQFSFPECSVDLHPCTRILVGGGYTKVFEKCFLLALGVQGTIEGRRDIAGGRLASDRRAAGNRTSGQCFTSLAFSADGSMLLAAGASKCDIFP